MSDKKLKMIILFWAPVILWMGLIFSLSSIPEENLPKVTIPYIHKIVHLVEYSILGILLARAVIHSYPYRSSAQLIAVSVILIFLYALSDEWHQTFVPGRSGEFSDCIYDTIYATIGIYFYYRIKR